MTHRFALLFALATSVARADSPPPPLDVFLEQRVAEELTADGLQLSRLGVSLDVEVIGDKAIVSLVDPSTGRVVASTKLDALPADREAAVASVTQVAANLAMQLQPPTPNNFKEALLDERADRERKEELEGRYKADAIHFGHVAVTDGKGATTGIAAIPFKGDRRLTPLEFYREVERPDLVERVRSRRRLGTGIAIAGGAAFVIGTYLILRGGSDFSQPFCDSFSPDEDECNAARDRKVSLAKRNLGLGFAGVFGGVTVGIIGWVVAMKNPLGEREVHDLADQHNAKLRKKLQLTPYVDPQGGGLAVSGGF